MQTFVEMIWNHPIITVGMYIVRMYAHACNSMQRVYVRHIILLRVYSKYIHNIHVCVYLPRFVLRELPTLSVAEATMALELNRSLVCKHDVIETRLRLV